MIIRVCAFTTEGWKLIETLQTHLPSVLFEPKEQNEDVDTWVKRGFELNAPILFVGAMGIAVRKIAPYVNSKLTDSPVIVMDEKGRFVVPVLSNHVGGANRIADLIAEAIGGQLVITTATDVQKAFAVDVFATDNGLKIVNKDAIKRVSSKLLEEGFIRMAINPGIDFDARFVPDCIHIVEFGKKETDADVIIDLPDENSKITPAPLILLFKPYVLGGGCKKDTGFEKIESFFTEQLRRNGIDESLVAGMASIDLKSKEKGLLIYEAKHRIAYSTYSAEELQAVDGEFSESEFVRNITGVSNVCERAAIKLGGQGAELLVGKIAEEGMTFALGRRKARINIWDN